MYITQLLDKFPLAPHTEIIISRLPERFHAVRDAKFPRDDLLQHLQAQRKRAPLRFADEQMHVLRHDHVTGNIKPIPLSHSFEAQDILVAGRLRAKPNTTVSSRTL